MWIVILNFCLFLLLASIFLYGLKHWNHLISEPEDEDEEPADDQLDTFYYRAPVWVLIIGCGIYSLVADVLFLLNG
ncbi:MAG: hypothetical protein PWR01_4190 [Clostridiales bacterium]|jgi:hypothetical protein|nr:hypothetical protein [Clostridiales bacterium]MDN5283117.1 hypothetical protein [Candidatus Ozemobacter sp.]